MQKYEPHISPKLLKLRKEFIDKHLEEVNQDLNEWITELESLLEGILMIQIVNSLLKRYNPIPINLEMRLMKKVNDPDQLVLDDLGEKLSDRYTHSIDK